MRGGIFAARRIAACRLRRHIHAAAWSALARVVPTRLIVVAIALMLTLPRRVSARRLLGRRLSALSWLPWTTRGVVLRALLWLVRAGIVSTAFRILILAFVSHSLISCVPSDSIARHGC